MIRAALLGATIFAAITCGSSGLAHAQNTQEELERALGLTETSEAAEDGEAEEDLVPSQKRTYQQQDTVILRALDKITGRSTDFEMDLDTPKVYGSLRIDLETCFQTPPEEPPESAAFLTITTATTLQVQTMAEPRDLTEEELNPAQTEDAVEAEAPDVRFSGWMFASSPGLNALEHPVYDIWVIACSEVDPSVLDPALPKE